jgi:hypothetical protein
MVTSTSLLIGVGSRFEQRVQNARDAEKHNRSIIAIRRSVVVAFPIAVAAADMAAAVLETLPASTLPVEGQIIGAVVISPKSVVLRNPQIGDE